MRLAVIADIHGNLPALEACLSTIRRAGVDAYACAGDVVGYGPFPNECVEMVAELAPVWVAGNHDLMALDRLSGEGCIRLAQESLVWTRGVLTADTRTHLSGLPLRADAAAGVVIAHGSLEDPREYTRRPAQAERQIVRLLEEGYERPVLLLGHTHHAWAWTHASGATTPSPKDAVALDTGGIVLNPGAVGQSREQSVLARFLILDLERREATFYAVPYDEARCREALVRAGLPADAYHLRPKRLRLLRRVVRRALGR